MDQAGIGFGGTGGGGGECGYTAGGLSPRWPEDYPPPGVWCISSKNMTHFFILIKEKKIIGVYISSKNITLFLIQKVCWCHLNVIYYWVYSEIINKMCKWFNVNISLIQEHPMSVLRNHR